LGRREGARGEKALILSAFCPSRRFGAGAGVFAVGKKFFLKSALFCS
jgi:hypothetical protein